MLRELKDARLPTEYPLFEAIWVYVKRLSIFVLVITVSGALLRIALGQVSFLSPEVFFLIGLSAIIYALWSRKRYIDYGRSSRSSVVMIGPISGNTVITGEVDAGEVTIIRSGSEAQTDQDTRTCAKCGYPLKQTARFCPTCGFANTLPADKPLLSPRPVQSTRDQERSE